MITDELIDMFNLNCEIITNYEQPTLKDHRNYFHQPRLPHSVT